MKRAYIFVIAFTLLALTASAQKTGSPTAAALDFYRALKEKRYVDGFHHSVYRGAVEGLSAAELKELEPDFMNTFARIPDKIEVLGEDVTGDTAIVSLRFDGAEQPYKVPLIHVHGEWLVGDQAELALVELQGHAFFFNTRMQVNENDTADLMERLIGAQIIYGKKYPNRCASMAELIRLGGVPKDLEDGEASGYRITMTLSADQSSFTALAVPVAYGKSGRLSFYADLNGLHAQDMKGQPATANSPVFQSK